MHALPLIFPFAAFGGIFLCIIVAVLTSHQRKMALLLNQQTLPIQEDPRVRQEVQELKQLVHEQTIALDSLRTQNERLLRSLQADRDLREQLGNAS